MSIKQFLRTRVDVLVKPLKAILVAVLPPDAAMKVEMNAMKKQTKEKKSIKEQAVRVVQKSMDHSMDATECWQSEVPRESIEPTVDTNTASPEIDAPATVEVAIQPFQSDQEIAKLRTLY